MAGSQPHTSPKNVWESWIRSSRPTPCWTWCGGTQPVRRSSRGWLPSATHWWCSTIWWCPKSGRSLGVDVHRWGSVLSPYESWNVNCDLFVCFLIKEDKGYWTRQTLHKNERLFFFMEPFIIVYPSWPWVWYSSKFLQLALLAVVSCIWVFRPQHTFLKFGFIAVCQYAEFLFRLSSWCILVMFPVANYYSQ